MCRCTPGRTKLQRLARRTQHCNMMKFQQRKRVLRQYVISLHAMDTAEQSLRNPDRGVKTTTAFRKKLLDAYMLLPQLRPKFVMPPHSDFNRFDRALLSSSLQPMAPWPLLLLSVASVHFVYAENFTFKSDEQIAQLGWPYLPDYRNPNGAWTLSHKVAFFLLYSACWLGVTASVHSCTGPKQRRILPKGPPDAELGNLTRECSASGPRPRYPESQLIHELILQRAEARAEATALIVPSPANVHITYAQLQAAVLQLAETLQDLGLEPGCIAALCMERSCAQVVAVLGVLASGGGYMPIDAAAPENRIAVLLQHSQARVLLADSERFRPQAQSAAIPLLLAGTEAWSLFFSLVGAKPTATTKGQQQRTRPPTSEAAMLIYTSGSTGAPKGIIYDHRHLLHGAWFWAEEHGVTERTVQLLKSPYFWAVMEWEFFPALLRGGSLVVASSDGHKSPDYMARVVHQHKVSVLMITPSVLDLLLDVHQLHAKDRLLSSLQHITTVGEPLPTALANRAVSMPHLNATIRCLVFL